MTTARLFVIRDPFAEEANVPGVACGLCGRPLCVSPRSADVGLSLTRGGIFVPQFLCDQCDLKRHGKLKLPGRLAMKIVIDFPNAEGGVRKAERNG